MLLHKRNILFNFSIILKHHSDSKLTKVTGIDFAAPRSLQREGRNEEKKGIRVRSSLKRPPTRLSFPPFVFSFTSVFFGPRVNALVEFSSFYFSRVCPLAFRFFFPPKHAISVCDPIAARLPKLNTDQDQEFAFAFDEFIVNRFSISLDFCVHALAPFV